MDHITSQLDDLTNLSDDQITELQSSIVSEFDTVEQADPTPESVDAMVSLADMLDTVRGEVARRSAQAEELASRAAEASSRVNGDAAQKDVAGDEAVAADSTEAVEPIQASAAEEEVEAMNPENTELAVEEVAEVEAPAEAELAAETETAEVTAPVEAELAVEEEPEAVAELAVEAVAEAEVPVEAELAVEEAPAEEVAPAEAELADEATPEAALAVETPEEATASNSEENINELSAQEEAITVTAAADEAFEAPADRRPVAQATVAPVAITAGADIPGYTAGSKLDGMSEVAVAMEKRIHSLRRVNGGDGEQHIVASITTQFPEERTLSGDMNSNSSKIEAVLASANEGNSLVAAGGVQPGFIANRYEIFGLGTDGRPVRDSLPSFQADRGGIRFITPPVLGSYSGSAGKWIENLQDGTTGTGISTGSKASLTVGAAAEQTAYTYAVTSQLQFGNMLTRAYPELITRHNQLALIAHSRVAENALLTAISGKSTAVTAGTVLGFARDFLTQIKVAGAAYRSRHRIARDTNLEAIVPAWIYDAMAADLTMAMPGDSTLADSYATINSYLSSSNVHITAQVDEGVFAAQSAGALASWPTSFKWYLFAEGSFLFLDGGSLDIGLIRDSTLVGTNDYKMFTETFEGLAFVGIESLAVTSTISINGAAAALQDTLADALAPKAAV